MPTPNDVILSSLSSSTGTMSSSVSNHKNKNGGISSTTTATNASRRTYDADEIRRLHDDEHGNVGLQVRLTMEDLECLDFILQPPKGGMVDEPCIRIGELMWSYLYDDPHPPPTAHIQIGDVERELRQHLELELLSDNDDLDDSANTNTNDNMPKRRSNKKKVSSQPRDDEATSTDAATGALSRL
jgi:hypothetical protein